MTWKDRVKTLSEQKSNSSCFECGKSSTDWASISFGNFFCVDCSGIHRGYGVRISKVKSVTLDEWSESEFNIMNKGGNENLKIYIKNNNLNYLKGIDLYSHRLIRKYVDELCGTKSSFVDDSNLNLRKKEYSGIDYEFKSHKNDYNRKGFEETYQDKIANTFWKISGFISKKSIILKDKSIEIGCQINENILAPTTKKIMEKSGEIKNKFTQKKGNNVKKSKMHENSHVEKNDYSKWD